MNDAYRVIPGFSTYFINRTGDLKRRNRLGRKNVIRPNIDGDLIVRLIDDNNIKRVCYIKDLIAIAFTEFEDD